jgi:oxidase EvaA
MITSTGMIRRLLLAESQSVSVVPVPDGHPDWVVHDGEIMNLKANYFNVRATRDSSGARTMVLRQTEPVLVGLLVSRIEDRVAFPLSIRSEPGLIGTSCLTTTIQSTETNYMRKHGGRATPFLDRFIDAASDHVHHDSIQYDWGDVYDGKVKRFLVVEVESDLEVPPGFVWVSTTIVRELLVEDHLITNDLRALLGVILGDIVPETIGDGRSRLTSARTKSTAPDGMPSVAEKESLSYVDIDQLRVVSDGQTHFVDDFGNSVGFYRTTAASREVASWVQPLLRLEATRQIVLYREAGPEGRFALTLARQRSVPDLELWAPAEPKSALVGHSHSCHTSGEGGRFLYHGIEVTITTLPEDSGKDSESWCDGTRWLSRDEVPRLVASSCRTALELRLAWSLIRALPNA